MTTDELAARARQAIDAWNTHEPEKVASFFSNLAIVRDPADPENAVKGRDEIVGRAEMILGGFSDAKLEILSMSVGAGVQEFDEKGEIVSEHAYWDATVFLRAAGALPASLATATGS